MNNFTPRSSILPSIDTKDSTVSNAPMRSPKFKFIADLRRVQQRDLIWASDERPSQWLIVPRLYSRIRVRQGEHCLLNRNKLICHLEESPGYENRLILAGRDGAGVDWLCSRKPQSSHWRLMRRDSGSVAGKIGLPDRLLSGPTSGTVVECMVAAALMLSDVRFEASSTLAGRPDFVVPSRRLAIFANGCHHHAHGCGFNRGYGHDRSPDEIAHIRRYDSQIVDSLCRLGWNVLIVWECGVGVSAGVNPGALADRVGRALQIPFQVMEIACQAGVSFGDSA